MEFLSEDFLLSTSVARELYHRYAEAEPIYDYHSHLSAADIAANRCFTSLSAIWLERDHYKWRAMRLNGVDERFCSGNASEEEKFAKWAATVPLTIGNPLYVWTHLELKRHFGITELLTPQNARRIHQQCSSLLATPEFSTVNILRRMRVKTVCTTDDPCDDLHPHELIAAADLDFCVRPTFRPDRLINTTDSVAYNAYLDKLSKTTNIEVRDFTSLFEAIQKRIEFFNSHGCLAADHAIDEFIFEEVPWGTIATTFQKVRSGKQIGATAWAQLRCATLLELARLYRAKGWVMMLHIGALRNINRRLKQFYGPDAGCDSIGDLPFAQPLARFLGTLDVKDNLPKTILFNSNPSDNELMATMAGNFFETGVAGKIQFGPAWWFLDQRNGIERQLTALSSAGLLAHFVGMTTDSRSFLSFPRHEYFRRILCRMFGEWTAAGEIPYDPETLGQFVSNICYSNAVRYFASREPMRA